MQRRLRRAAPTVDVGLGAAVVARELHRPVAHDVDVERVALRRVQIRRHGDHKRGGQRFARPPGTGPFSIATADLDANGHLDLVLPMHGAGVDCLLGNARLGPRT